MRSSLLFLAGIFTLAAACGGQTGGLGGDGGGPEASSGSGGSSGGSGSSSGSTTGSSGSSSGAGVCEPLPGCDSAVECPGPTPCSTCECYDGEWSCNGLDCADGGVDAYPECPTFLPEPGLACPQAGSFCYYPFDAGCGGEECECSDQGFWSCSETVCFDSGPPPDSGFYDAGEICPGSQPQESSACDDEGDVCTYYNGCETNCLCAAGGWVCAQQQGCIPGDF